MGDEDLLRINETLSGRMRPQVLIPRDQRRRTGRLHGETHITKKTVEPIMAGNLWSFRPNRAMVCSADV